MWIPSMSLYVFMWNVIACDVDDIEMRWKDRQNVKPNETVQIMECVTNIVFIE